MPYAPNNQGLCIISNIFAPIMEFPCDIIKFPDNFLQGNYANLPKIVKNVPSLESVEGYLSYSSKNEKWFIKNRTMGPWLIWQGFHEICWISSAFSGANRWNLADFMKSGGFHVRSWKMQISKCKNFKTIITLSLCKPDNQFLGYR